MAREKFVSPIWQEASELFANSTLGDNPPVETGEINHGSNIADLRYTSESSKLVTNIQYYDSVNFGGKNKLLMITIQGIADRWTLSRNGIYYEENFRGIWPVHSSDWSAGLDNPDQKGELEEFTLKLPDFVSYSKTSSWNANPRRDFPGVPLSLQNQAQVLGFNINWNIDYDAKAKDILEASELLERTR